MRSLPNLLLDRSFREADLDRDLVLGPECEASPASVNLEMVAVSLVTACCIWATWFDVLRDASPTRITNLHMPEWSVCSSEVSAVKKTVAAL